MAATDKKQRRKALLAQVKQAERATLEAGLPVSPLELKALLNAVNARLETEDCDHTLRHTQAFLNEQRLPEQPVLAWLREHSGFCDCEVIANVEDAWDKGERA